LYVNAVLIYRAGRDVRSPCGACVAKAARSPYGVPAPFPTCRKISGYFGGCCSNCKWPDGAASCSVRDGAEGDRHPGQRALPPPPPRALPPPPPRLLSPPPRPATIAAVRPRLALPAPAAAGPPPPGNDDNPIVVKDEDDDNDNWGQGRGGSQEDPILLD
jgi:hypothetical protein